MGAGNINFELQNTAFRDPEVSMADAGNTLSTVPVKLLNIRDGTFGKLCILMAVDGDPDTYAVASGGYTTDFSPGCVAIEVGSGACYVQTSAVSVPNWAVQT